MLDLKILKDRCIHPYKVWAWEWSNLRFLTVFLLLENEEIFNSIEYFFFFPKNSIYVWWIPLGGEFQVSYGLKGW